MNIEIKNGRLIDPASGLDAVTHLYISQGRIAAIGNAPGGFTADRSIDAQGLIVAPGLVDLAARLREPGFEYKATLVSEMNAAVAGGITSLACPPDTDPPLDEPGLVEMLKHRARQLNLANVYPVGALTQQLKGQRLTEMAELTDAGCVAFSQVDQPFENNLSLMRALQYASTFGFSVWLRPQDHGLAAKGVAHDGEVASRLGLPPIPIAAETVAISTVLLLVKETGARVHFCRVSSASGLQMIRDAKQQGLPVTCDVGIHHVHLSDNDIGYFDPHYHLAPPLRSTYDRDAIRAALLDGTIDAICSDHTPVDEDAKLLPFAESEPGATGLEVLLPLTLKWAEEQCLPIDQALAKITIRSAQILGINAGLLVENVPADICIFDPEAEWKVDTKNLVSQGKNSPFAGYPMRGKVRFTLVNGQIVYQAE
ncbi:dihydroorotase [Chitinivorax tropicus]|uniref:Dihydroorotase n=1 Tax=Chitinivorax tropicus TaxID=714531 RepID=A0A840MLQ6_9PROT|nr:dihydroorotase [Chitinivorax tropicus]MBB5019340.1 dihydroorotase [Chitinivorax tropicus]